MQQYQQFWHNKYSHLDSQFQLDYDTFISIFTQQIKTRTSIQLTQSQKQIIKQEIDPQNQNQVYKNGYLLFVKNFWGIASTRTRFFNMKINLSKLRGHNGNSGIVNMDMVGWIKIKVQYQMEKEQQQGMNEIHGGVHKNVKVVDEYLIEKDKISLVHSTDKSKILKKQQLLPLKGFIKIGSSQQNQIIIPNSSINPEHLKIIYHTNLQQQGKSTASFQSKPTPITHPYIRDISHSNRTRYLIDNQNKYFVIKNGMIIQGIGLLQGIFQIVIESGAGNVQESDIQNLRKSFNAERKGFYIGESDRPIKSIINYQTQSITQAQIIDLYDRNLYYPQPKQKQKATSTSTSSTKQQKSRPSLKFHLLNKRTLQKLNYDSKQHKILTIGRDPQKCNIIIDHISIRPIQFTFENINDIWFIRRTNISKIGEKLNSVVSVNLSKDKFRCSNRLPLGVDYPEKFVIKGEVFITVQVKNKEDINQDDY